MKSELALSMMSRHLIYCDVGARDGIDEPWKSFRNIIDVISFEPDQEEYDRLMSSKRENDATYNYALSKDKEDILLNLTKARGCSSVLKPNRYFLDNFPNSDRFDIEKTVKIKSTTLDTLNKDSILNNIDFIKIDVQGSELDVLKGGEKFLKDHILGLQVEVEFNPMYQDQPLFSDVDIFVRNSLGLQLQDLKKLYWKKYKEGINVGGPKGKLIFGDALYFRPPQEMLSWCSQFNKKEALNKILMACQIGIIYGYLDYSLSLLKQPNINDFMPKDVTDNLLVNITCFGKSLRYRGIGASKFAVILNLLYKIFQPDLGGWAATGDRLGMKKKFGIYY